MMGRTAFCLCVLVVAWFGPSALAATYVEHRIDFDPGLVGVQDGLHGARVAYPRSTSAEPVGSPDLPTQVRWIEIPADAHVIDLIAVPHQTRVVDHAERVVPRQHDRQPGDQAADVDLEASAYTGAGLYPAVWAQLGGEVTMRGHRLVAVLVHPVRWNRDSGELVAIDGLQVRLELGAGARTPMLERHRVVNDIETRYEHALAPQVAGFRSLTDSPGAGVAFAGAPAGPAGPGPFQPTFRPTADGSPVEYVIVTNEALEPEFQRLADWKTEKGVQAVVRTVEWIDATYPNGVDRAERVRFFIRDAYQNWGTLFVLIGGDTDVVPPRYGFFAFLGGEDIPADLYYGALDGNWNGDGDDIFGEAANVSSGTAGDEADLVAEVSIGRAPVSTLEEAQGFIDKQLQYEKDAPTNIHYPASIVVLAERLFLNQHGAEVAEQALELMPPWFKIVRLYEESASWPGSIELNKSAAIDSVDNGFGMVLHVGHGFRNTMSVGDQTLNNADADNLANDPRQSVVFAINCSSAAIDFNSIGERWVKNPSGGSVAYIGTSRLAFVVASEIYQDAWFETVFVDSVTSVGLASDIAALDLAPLSSEDTAWRWNLLATTLLGDPEFKLYNNEVIPLTAGHPPTFELGTASMLVAATSAGQPVDGARVTLMREGEAYSTGVVDGTGVVTVPFLPETAGDVTLTIEHSPYRHYQTTLQAVATSDAFLHVSGVTVDDNNVGASSGDGDGAVDAGETIELPVNLTNGGGSAATSVNAVLTIDDPAGAITILNDTVSYGTIAAGGTSGGSSRFLIEVAPDAPTAYQPVCTVALTAGQGAWEDVFVLNVRRPHLEHYEHLVDDSVPRGNGNGLAESGEEIWYTVTLRNTGQDVARGVSATLAAVSAADSTTPHPQVTVLDDSSSYADIAVDAQVDGDRFEFDLGGADPSDVLLEVTWTDDLGPIGVEYLDLISPVSPDTVQAFGSTSTITLRWQRPDDEDLKGYDIYRSSSVGGPFTRINAFTADGSATYEDAGLPSLSRFFYQVVARDLSYNESVPSVTVSGTTNPPMKSGWPQELGQQTQSSINFSDTVGDAGLEIFTAADYQYAWHADGTEVVDGDDEARTNGVYSVRGFDSTKGFGATTVIGDIDRDGDLEIANVGWNRDSLFVWDHEAQMVPGWPKAVFDDFNWPSPVMANIDADPELELLVWTAKGGRLLAWNHDGTEVLDGDSNPGTDGVFFREFGTSFSYSSPAVGDLDGDGEQEIVLGVNLSDDNSGKVFVLQNDGSIRSGWPFATGSVSTPSQVTASPAIADVDNDGTFEIIIVADRSGGQLYVLNPDGTLRAGWPRPVPSFSGTGRSASPVPADLNNDGQLELIYPNSNGALNVFDNFGNTFPGFPVTFMPGGVEATQSTPCVADIDADLQMEILFGDESGKLHGYNSDGSQIDGFPIQLTGEVRSTPAVWDVDLDGQVEIMLTGWDLNVYIWDIPAPFDAGRAPWPLFRHDSRNSGWARAAVLPIAVSDPLDGAQSAIAVPRVYPPHPNPFNPFTTFEFDVPGEGSRQVAVSIYDVHGRLVRRLLDGAVEAGRHAITWDGRASSGRPLGTGVYLYRVHIDAFEATGKIVMVK